MCCGIYPLNTGLPRNRVVHWPERYSKFCAMEGNRVKPRRGGLYRGVGDSYPRIGTVARRWASLRCVCRAACLVLKE